MPAALTLKRLSLRRFRSYPELVWRPEQRISVIAGPNGAGKTNLLEAVSLLAPGRGLRGARLGELALVGPEGDGTWAVAGGLQHPLEGLTEVATGTLEPGASERRLFRLDGRPATRAAASARITIVWLTPEMSGLFQEGPLGRRRFLDRLVYGLEPGHARELAAYEAAMIRRNRVLAGAPSETAWLAGLEESMARHAVAVAAARQLLIARITRRLGEAAPGLPGIALAFACPIGERLQGQPALAVEEWLAGELARRRQADRDQGSAGLGVHRGDLVMRLKPGGTPAGRASTGEQKALLLQLVLAQAALVAERHGFAPLLLLDEPLANLDARRRAIVCAILAAGPSEVLLTGTDAGLFRPLGGEAEFLVVGGGRLASAGGAGMLYGAVPDDL